MIELVDNSKLDKLNCFLSDNNLLKIEIEELCNNPFLKVCYYTKDDNIIGYLNYSVMYDKAELNQIYISKEYRNLGLGSQLLKYFIDNCSECRIFTLEVKEDNHTAIHLYEKFNFVTVAVRKYYYGKTNGLLMMYERGE